MPFPRPLTSAELDLLRDYGDYRASTNLAYCPQTTVMAARVNGGIASGVFAQVNFDTVTAGAYTDLRAGMTVYFSLSSDIRNAYLTTRVRKTPTSAILYIAEAASVIQDNDYIIVVNDFRLWEKLGRIGSDGTLYTDYDVTFKKPAPLIGNLQSAYIDPRPTGDTTLTFNPTGIPMAQDATTTLTWLWDVADGTITAGTTTTQRITATFPQGERWVRVTVTDSNGTTNFRVFWVNVGLTYTLQNIDNPPVSGSLEDGWNCSLNVQDVQSYAPLRTLPEHTLCVIYTSEIFGDGSSTPLVTNIDFIGRTRQESGHSTGTDEWSTLQTGSLELEGIGSQLNRLSSPQLAIQHDTTPTVPGEVNRPTVPRFIGHLCSYFNTLSSIHSLHFDIPFTYISATTNTDATVTVADTGPLRPGMGVSGTGIPGGATVLSITGGTQFELSANATATGTPALVYTPVSSDNRFISQSLTLTETGAGAALDRMAKWINAGLDYAASGEIEVKRHAFYRQSDDLATTADLDNTTSGDLLEFTLDIDYPERVGRVFSGAEFFNTTLNSTKYITGSAPPVARGNGEGQASEDGQILTADQTDAATIIELNGRTAALFADSQPKDKIDVLFYDSWRGVFVPSRSRWFTLTLGSAENILGRVYSTSQNWICTAVNYNMLLESGEVGSRATFIRAPASGAAQVTSAISPALITPALPDLPAFNPYPGMDLSPYINYPTDTPAIEDLQPIDSYSQALGDEGMAGSFPPPGCRSYNIMFNDSTGITTPALTAAATYTVRASGEGQIDDNGWSHTIDFTASDGGFVTYPGGGGSDGGVYTGGSGWGAAAAQPGRGHFVFLFASARFITTISLTRSQIITGSQKFLDIGEWDGAAITNSQSVVQDNLTESYIVNQTWDGIFVGQYMGSDPATPTLNGHVTAITVTGQGTNPFTGGGGAGIVYADAFYYFYASNINVGYPYTGYGLTFDGSEPNTIPPYNTNHVYNTTLTGDGSTVVVKFNDTDYSDNVAIPLKVRICGAGL